MSFLDTLRWKSANARARSGRMAFRKMLETDPAFSAVPRCPEKAAFDLVSFSSERDVEEQVFSLLSFLFWVGEPDSWTVYSDGTHSNRSLAWLTGLSPKVRVKNWNERAGQIAEEAKFLSGYAEQQAMGKRLIAYSTHPLEKPTAFLDSDILFYREARGLLAKAAEDKACWFLPDMGWGALDSRFKNREPDMYQVNGGFFLLKPGFSWSPIFSYLQTLDNRFEYFSDQTAFHVAFMEEGLKPLDPRKFVVSVSDQFKTGLGYTPSQLALRHYVAIVRHKMWETGWKSHLEG